MKCKKMKWYHWVLLAIAVLAIVYCAIFLCLCKGCTQWPHLIMDGLNIIVLTITAIIALSAYSRGKKIEEANFLLKLRELLASEKNMEVHRFFCTEDNESSQFLNYTKGFNIDKHLDFDTVDLYNYLGTLELANILLLQDIISEESFKSQFGYRIENIKTPAIQSMLNGEKGYWDDLEELIKKFGNHN